MIARGAERLVILVTVLMMASVLLSYIISIALAILLVAILIIFRDPDILIAPGIISPVDGKILSVDRKSNSILLQIDLLGKRVLRAPISGMIENYSEKESQSMRNTVLWTSDKDNFKLFAISSPRIGIKLSTIKRRKFVLYSQASENVMKGDRIGLLFRTRLVKIELRGTSAEIVVRPGMLVLAGESILARIPVHTLESELSIEN